MSRVQSCGDQIGHPSPWGEGEGWWGVSCRVLRHRDLPGPRNINIFINLRVGGDEVVNTTVPPRLRSIKFIILITSNILRVFL